MERRIQTLKKISFSFLFAVLIFTQASFEFSQEAQQDKQLRIELWAELDAYPGLVLSDTLENQSSQNSKSTESSNSNKNSIYEYAVSRLKEIAPFIMGGMINGWTFDYTPSDKIRSVDEYFSYSPVQEFNQKVNPLEYKKIEVIDGNLDCWVYCNRTKEQQLAYGAWTSIKNPKIHGTGQGSIEEGFDGIKTAVENAIKDAVREYWRTLIKNKPKEIDGKVLLIKAPRIYVKSGKYTVDLDFFMETGRIIKYSYY